MHIEFIQSLVQQSSSSFAIVSEAWLEMCRVRSKLRGRRERVEGGASESAM